MRNMLPKLNLHGETTSVNTPQTFFTSNHFRSDTADFLYTITMKPNRPQHLDHPGPRRRLVPEGEDALHWRFWSFGCFLGMLQVEASSVLVSTKLLTIVMETKGSKVPKYHKSTRAPRNPKHPKKTHAPLNPEGGPCAPGHPGRRCP